MSITIYVTRLKIYVITPQKHAFFEAKTWIFNHHQIAQNQQSIDNEHFKKIKKNTHFFDQL